MGVRGLETFLQKQVPNGVCSINILDEISRTKSKHPDRPVILVFQVIDILFNVIHNLSSKEIICGPAFQKIHQLFDNRFQQLQNTGAELHFFVNGPAYSHDFETWKKKESENYSAGIAVIDKIDSNVPIDEIEIIDHPSGAINSMYHVLNVCQKYGIVHVSMNPKHTVDVVKYSNENDALAIVSNNSHFLVFNGNWRYWSCRDIGLMEENWNTVEYDKSALLKHIGLSQLQMPMLATLAGNDFVPYEKLVSFHKKIHGTEIDFYKEHFLKLAEYVQQIPNVLSNDDKRQFLLDLFGCIELHNFVMVRDSLLFYTTTSRGDTEGNVDSLLTSAASIGATYYNSLTEAPIRIKMPSLFDLRRTDFLPFIDITSPILKRQIGLIRQHKNDTNYQHVIELRLSHSDPRRSIRLTPEYPVVHLPDLMELSFNENNDYFNGFRFRLLKWMLFGKDIHSEFRIQDIPQGYIVTVLAVMYLCKLKQLTSSEANAILLSIHLIHENQEYDRYFYVPTKISSRDVIASHLYICVHNIVVKCFLILGLKNFAEFLSIDGIYFVHWLNKIKTEDCKDDLSQIEYLKYFFKFV